MTKEEAIKYLTDIERRIARAAEHVNRKRSWRQSVTVAKYKNEIAAIQVAIYELAQHDKRIT